MDIQKLVDLLSNKFPLFIFEPGDEDITGVWPIIVQLWSYGEESEKQYYGEIFPEDKFFTPEPVDIPVYYELEYGLKGTGWQIVIFFEISEE